MPAAEPYLIQSRNTDFYVVSTRDDKIKQQVDTKDGKDSIPPNAVLRVNPPLRGSVIPNVVITGASGLHIALEGTAEKTKLTWSNEEYKWIVRATGTGSPTYYITPANGADLYWFDEFGVGVGNHIEVRAGKNIKPPQAEWVITAILR